MLSIRQKFILPLMIIGLLLFGIVSVVSSNIMYQTIREQARAQMQMVAHAIDQVTIIAGDRAKLRRLVHMIGAGRQIKDISLIRGSDFEVIASTDSKIVNHKLPEVISYHSFSKRSLEADDELFQFNKEKFVAELATTIRFREKDGVRDTKGVLFIRLDVKKHIQESNQQLKVVELIVFSGLLLLIMVTYLFGDKLILRPILEIANTMKGWREGKSKTTKIYFNDEIGRLAKQFNEFAAEISASEEKALSASRAKSAFLSNMSHEIRTPLTAILGNAEITHDLLEKKGLQVECEMVYRIKVNSDHLLHLINDILDLSKIEAGKLELEFGFFNLRDIVSNVKNMFTNTAKDKNIQLLVELTEDVPENVCADLVRIKQILINLVGNAIKFTSDGGAVKILIRFDKPALIIKVIDTGIGIEQENIDKLFSAFTQADESVTRKFGGTGLGLSISKQLCELMGGELTCESELGEGTSFTASIILDDTKCAIASKKSDVHIPEVAKLRQTLQSRRVLVAEDWVDNQRIIEWHLKQVNVEFDIVDDGQKAVDMAQKNTYGLILMDIQMPILDGINATQAIKSKYIETPIIALTANALKEQVDDYEKAGFDGFLAKPFVAEDFRRLISSYLGGNEKRVELGDDFELSDEFIKIKQDFVKTLSPNILDIEKSFKEKDFTTLERLVHSLKSSSASFHFYEMAKLAEAVESYLHDNQSPDIANLAKKVKILIENMQITKDNELSSLKKDALRSAKVGNDTILLVDDDPIMQALGSAMLEKIGFCVETATNGAEAINKAKQKAYSLILMDCEMPEMDGFSAAKAILTDGQNNNTAIVAMTGHDASTIRTKCRDAGMHAILQKPVTKDKLTNLLHDYFDDVGL